MTRMWGIDVKMLCNQHLLGEHKEMHQAVGHINHNHMNVMLGHAGRGQIDIGMIPERHGELADELKRRGMNHKSPLPGFIWSGFNGELDLQYNINDLRARCKDCFKEGIYDV